MLSPQTGQAKCLLSFATVIRSFASLLSQKASISRRNRIGKG